MSQPAVDTDSGRAAPLVSMRSLAVLMVAFLVAQVVALGGCGGSVPSATPGATRRAAPVAAVTSAPAATAAPAAVAEPEPLAVPTLPAPNEAKGWPLMVDGTSYRYERGLADDSLGLRLEFRFAPRGRGAALKVIAYPPSGPNGDYFAGGSFGVAMSLDGAKSLSLEAHQAELTLEPFELAPDAVIRGRLRIDATLLGSAGAARYAGEGEFEVTYRGAAQSRANPDLVAALEGPLRVELEDKPFVPRSILANVVRDPSGDDILSDLVLYERAGATCVHEPLGDSVVVELNARTGAATRPGPQPTSGVRARRRSASGVKQAITWYPMGWYTLKPDPLLAGGSAHGQLVVQRSLFYTGVEADPYRNAVASAGRFAAHVCHRGDTADWRQVQAAIDP